MADGVTPATARSATVGVAQVALDPLRGGVEVVRAGRVRDGQQRVDRPHGVPLLDQGVDHVRADEAGSAGDEDGHVSLSQDAGRTVEQVRHVILPVLERARGAAVGARAHARGIRAARRRQRLDRRLRRARRRARRRGRARAAAAASAPPASPGCARPAPRSSASWTATPPSIRASCRGWPTRSTPARRSCMLGARDAQPGAWPLHARAGEPGADGGAAAAHGRRAARSRADARGAPRGAARASGCVDRRFGWPLEMVVRAAAAGWRIDEVDVTYLPRNGPLEGHRDRAGHAAHGARHGGGAARERDRCIVIAKAPVPGRVKTRLTPPCAPSRPPRWPRAALEDTLAAVGARAWRPAAWWSLDGEPDGWLPDGLRAGRAARRRPRRSASPRPSTTSEGPALLVAMDTPQVTPELLDAGLAALADGATPCSARRRRRLLDDRARARRPARVRRRADERAPHRRGAARAPDARSGS